MDFVVQAGDIQAVLHSAAAGGIPERAGVEEEVLAADIPEKEGAEEEVLAAVGSLEKEAIEEEDPVVEDVLGRIR